MSRRLRATDGLNSLLVSVGFVDKNGNHQPYPFNLKLRKHLNIF